MCANKFDESLAIYAGLLTVAGTLTYTGEHYIAGPNDFLLPPGAPPPPHPPVWDVAAPTSGGGRQPSLECAARWQCVIPAIHPPDEGGPKTVAAFAGGIEPVRAWAPASDVRGRAVTSSSRPTPTGAVSGERFWELPTSVRRQETDWHFSCVFETLRTDRETSGTGLTASAT